MMDNLALESDSENQFSDDESALESSDCDASENSDGNASDGGNTGWANSMAKILKASKPKNKKSVVLSKTKKLNELQKIKKENSYDFQIDNELKPDIKDEKIKTEDDFDIEEKLKFNIFGSRQKAREYMRLCRVKPSLADRERERAFKKIATKGVVQLFNAVKHQQKEISKKLEAAGRLDHRRERVLNSLDKRAFLDVLMGGARAKSELVDNPVKDEIKNEDSDEDDEPSTPSKKTKSWDIFKDDFLVNKKLTNWDKKTGDSDDEEEVNEDDRGNVEYDDSDENSS